MGFERCIKNMPLAQKLEINLFCNFWIDYESNEDLFQVVELNDEAIKYIKETFKPAWKIYEQS